MFFVGTGGRKEGELNIIWPPDVDLGVEESWIRQPLLRQGSSEKQRSQGMQAVEAGGRCS